MRITIATVSIGSVCRASNLRGIRPLASRDLGGRLASSRALTHQSQRRNSADQHNPAADQQHIIEGTDE